MEYTPRPSIALHVRVPFLSQVLDNILALSERAVEFREPKHKKSHFTTLFFHVPHSHHPYTAIYYSTHQHHLFSIQSPILTTALGQKEKAKQEIMPSFWLSKSMMCMFNMVQWREKKKNSYKLYKKGSRW